MPVYYHVAVKIRKPICGHDPPEKIEEPHIYPYGCICNYVYGLLSFIYIPLHGARRAMAAALPLPLADGGGFYTFFTVS